MRLHFPDLSIFVAAIQANSSLSATVQLVVIADVEHEVCALLASSQYASALAAFFATPSHEQQSAHQHAQRIIADARVNALIASNTAITQAAAVPSRPATRRPPERVTAEDVAEYCQKRVQTQQQRAELQAKALALLAAGSSVVDVAAKFNLSQTTVGRWRRENPAQARYTPYGATRKPAATRTRHDLAYDSEKMAEALRLLAKGAFVSEVAAQMKIPAMVLRKTYREQQQSAAASPSTSASTQPEQPQQPSPPSNTPETTITIDLTVEETSPSSPEAPVTPPEQAGATPPPAPSSPSSWLDEEQLLEWAADNCASTSTQAPAPQSSPSPQPQDSDNQTDVNDQEFIEWLLSDNSQVMPQPQQEPQPQPRPQAPPPLPSVPLPPSQAGLVRVQIEELRLIIISSLPRNHGIHSDDWAPDAVKLFILQRYQRLLSLAQVQELLDIHIAPFLSSK